jgi:monovalent cation/proton antiporter MnhG/PhaG subunit
MGVVLDIVAAILLFAGLLLATIGLFGLLRMRDIFHQLHPAGLVSGPALLLVLLAAIGTRSTAIVTSAALVFVFLLITSSLSNHAIANAARQRRLRVEAAADGSHDDPATSSSAD